MTTRERAEGAREALRLLLAAYAACEAPIVIRDKPWPCLGHLAAALLTLGCQPDRAVSLARELVRIGTDDGSAADAAVEAGAWRSARACHGLATVEALEALQAATALTHDRPPGGRVH